jgi:hypothetical protein
VFCSVIGASSFKRHHPSETSISERLGVAMELRAAHCPVFGQSEPSIAKRS